MGTRNSAWETQGSYIRAIQAPTQTPDVIVLGAGIVGLSLALELQSRGAKVLVLDTAKAMQGASSAAAGMLAAEDPHNPPQLLPLSRYSCSLYRGFLDRIADLSGQRVRFQTETTIQYGDDGSTVRLAEHSLDPRQLAAALLASVRAAEIPLIEDVKSTEILETTDAAQVRTGTGLEFGAPNIVHAEGAAYRSDRRFGYRKGQMLRVALPAGLRDLRDVHRSERIYIVPRTSGPQAGSALIGATVEEANDTIVHPEALARLRSLAAELLPTLADASIAPQLEAWAGLRPWCASGLPYIGPAIGHASIREFFALGHYRNGILLAPATAQILADILEGKPPAIDISPFQLHPIGRPGPISHSSSDIRPPSDDNP